MCTLSIEHFLCSPRASSVIQSVTLNKRLVGGHTHSLFFLHGRHQKENLGTKIYIYVHSRSDYEWCFLSLKNEGEKNSCCWTRSHSKGKRYNCAVELVTVPVHHDVILGSAPDTTINVTIHSSTTLSPLVFFYPTQQHFLHDGSVSFSSKAARKRVCTMYSTHKHKVSRWRRNRPFHILFFSKSEHFFRIVYAQANLDGLHDTKNCHWIFFRLEALRSCPTWNMQSVSIFVT